VIRVRLRWEIQAEHVMYVLCQAEAASFAVLERLVLALIYAEVLGLLALLGPVLQCVLLRAKRAQICSLIP
jgi:hypothetical protein